MHSKAECECKPDSRRSQRLQDFSHGRQSTGTRYDTDTYHSYDQSSYRGYTPSRHQQTQMQGQLQRSVEDSKQMLYGTFGNVIAILEEFERRELKAKGMQISQRYQSSNIDIPDQRHKQFADVKSNVETQILLFETQSKACPEEVRQELLEDLKKKTLGWAAVRGEMGVDEIQETDRYISKLYEILAKGRTDHKVPSRQGLTENVMRDSYQHILYGDHDRQMIDQSFKRDPNKKATAPDTRHSEMLDEGARRIAKAHGKSDLDSSLRYDVRRLKDYGPSDLK